MRYAYVVMPTLSTALIVLSASGCSQVSGSAADGPQPVASEPTVAYGEAQPLGDGTVRAYVELDEQNQPKTLGVIMTDTALSNLPEQTAEVVLPLPAEAATTGFTHIGLDWQTHGHNPMSIYGVPHFDVHAYTLMPTERETITAAGSDLEKAYRTPDADLVPAGYVLAPDSAEPRMGAHWVNPTSEELQGEPHGFSHTLIYGYYDGKMAFIEPMVSLDFLKRQQDFEGTMPVPKRYSREGAYPTGYSITYDETTQEHTVALTGFTQL